MNWMNINEPFFGSGDSLCFVAEKWGFIAISSVILAVRYITNAMAAPKIQFIQVHLVHLDASLERVFYFLMNLMNLDVLTDCLWLSFVMGQKASLGGWLSGLSPSSPMFIRFIGKEC